MICKNINISSNTSLEQTGLRDCLHEFHSVKCLMHFIVLLELIFHEFHLAARHIPSFLLDSKDELKDSKIYHRVCKKQDLNH